MNRTIDDDRIGPGEDDNQPTEPRTTDVGVTTGTTTLGLAGEDGVVLAADARASLGGRFVTTRSMRKVEPIGDRTAVTFSGGVSDAQSFVRTLRAERRLYELRHGRPPAAAALASVAAERIRAGEFRSAWLLLGGVGEEPTIYEIDRAGGVMATDYAATGSGMQLAYGALERTYDPDAPIADLRPIAADAIESAAERDAASGDGMTVVTITDGALELERYEELGSDALGAGRSADSTGEVA